MIERLGVHKRWKQDYLLKELGKRVFWPDDRPDVRDFYEGLLKELMQYAGLLPLAGDSEKSAMSISVTLDAHSLRLLRVVVYDILKGGGNSIDGLAIALLYKLRALQMWQSRNLLWILEGKKPHAYSQFDDTGYALATAFAMGWMSAGTKLGNVTLQMLPLGAFTDANPFLSERVKPARRCFAWFAVKLFADWSGQSLPDPLPRHPYPSQPYEVLLACWRDPNPVHLIEPLLAACDWHTHEAIYSRSDDSHKDVDFGLDPYMGWPIEIHMVYRLRESLGLTNPATLDHPLMKTALGPYLPAQAMPHDELLERITARALIEYQTLAQLL